MKARSIIRGASLAVAAALAIWVPSRETWEALRAPARNVATDFDRFLGPVRGALPAGARAYFLVMPGRPDQEQARLALAQYALAPVVVLPLRLRECMGGACDLRASPLLILDSSDPRQLEWAAGTFGMRPVLVLPGASVLSREAP